MKKLIILSTFMSLVAFLLAPQLVTAESNNSERQMYSYTTVYPDGYEPSENTKTVYLTFDDGPTKYTPEIIEILAKYEILATFFVVGNTEYTHYMRDIVENGHAIGLHSYNHKFKEIYSSTDAFFKDLQKIDDIVFEQTGVRSKITRFPGGSSVTKGGAKAIMRQLSEEIVEKGYQFFDWNCDSRDKMGVKTASGALEKIKAATEQSGNIVIVLMHDTEKITIEYLPSVIEYYQELGYEFSVLSPSSPCIRHSW